MKLRHIKTNKIYDWNGSNTTYIDPKPPFLPDRAYVSVRTNAEVYPEQFYDFSRTELDGCTMYYVEEPLSDFEILEE
jgi:hypothetical protein